MGTKRGGDWGGPGALGGAGAARGQGLVKRGPAVGAALRALDLRPRAGAVWGAGSRAARRKAGSGRPGWRRARRPPSEAGTRGSRTSSSWRAPRRPGLGTGEPLVRPAGGQAGRAGQGPDGVEGRGGAQRYRGQTGAQTETGGRMDVQRRAVRETQRQTRAGVINLA